MAVIALYQVWSIFNAKGLIQGTQKQFWQTQSLQ